MKEEKEKMNEEQLRVIDAEINEFRVNGKLTPEGESLYLCTKGVLRKDIHMGQTIFLVQFDQTGTSQYSFWDDRVRTYKWWKEKKRLEMQATKERILTNENDNKEKSDKAEEDSSKEGGISEALQQNELEGNR